MYQNFKDIKPYDIVILLCASELNQDDYFDETHIKNKNTLYLGGQIRMDAAVDFATHVRKYFVVGGSEKKVSDMKNYMENKLDKYKIEPRPNIIRIKSDPDTTGNLWAVKMVLQKAQKLNVLKGRVGIMTNFYHLPRAMRFAIDIFDGVDVHFIPIAAEAIIVRHQPTYSLHKDAFLVSVSGDINGLRDWENNEYRKQDKKEGWCYECLDNDILMQIE